MSGIEDVGTGKFSCKNICLYTGGEQTQCHRNIVWNMFLWILIFLFSTRPLEVVNTLIQMFYVWTNSESTRVNVCVEEGHKCK